MDTERSPSAAIGSRLRELRDEHGWKQDDVAVAARRMGLDWSQATVAAIETGRRDLTIGELVLLPLTLGVAPLGADGVRLVDLVPAGSDRVRLGPDATATGDGVRQMLAGDGLDADGLDVPALRPPEGLGDAFRAAKLDAGQLVEQRAARRLGVSPLRAALMARDRWGHGLTVERDQRVAEVLDDGGGDRRAVAGHVTRALIAELRSALEASED